MIQAAFNTSHLDGDCRFLILCDHASNYVPPALDSLGLPPAYLSRHIAYDPGAVDVARLVADRLACPLVEAGFSRLLIDPNRGLDDPTLVMKFSDGVMIPANRAVDRFNDIQEWQARINSYYKPYHAAIALAIDHATAQNIAPIVLSVHSFTPVWKTQPRPWQAAILWDKDDRLRNLAVAHMSQYADVNFGDNVPYSGRLKNDCLYRHATSNGLAHGLIELRQDEIAETHAQRLWAERLVGLLHAAACDPDMTRARQFGSFCES